MTKKNVQNPMQYEISGILMILCSIFFYISLFSANSGIAGDIVREILFGVFGLGAYIFPLLVITLGIAAVYMKNQMRIHIRFYAFCIFLLCSLVVLFIANMDVFSRVELTWGETIQTSYQLGTTGIGGGAVGGLLGYAFVKLFGTTGSIAILVGLYTISILMFTQISLTVVLDFLKSQITKLLAKSKDNLEVIIKSHQENIKENKKPIEKKRVKEEKQMEAEQDRIKEIDKKIKILDFTKEFDGGNQVANEEPQKQDEGREVLKELIKERREPHIQEPIQKPKPPKAEKIEKDGDSSIHIIPTNSQQFTNYQLPNTSLLNLPQENKSGNAKKEVMNNVKTLDETLKNFGVSATISQVNIGPTITRYELQLSPGVKVSKILGLADDISLSLASAGIRIEAPIPGKSAVGIEVPNKDVSSVLLREVLESDEFKNHKSKIAFAIGKDVAGATITADLAKMPHLLIAGATGSGKSVCINTLITSILYKSTPDEVKLLMIDPKVVELGIYKNIPHLLVPVVTDPKKAAGALNWAVQEMTDRYKKFAANNVRDIYGYNAMGKEGIDKLPQIVVIIDELADLMMVAPSDVEDAICRLAQMARAAGIHLVVATQRPSVDVITGLIKANIPSRISFAVSSQVDSRTILDMAGAEKLLGKGDMLFYPVGESKPIRVQGAFITEKEVESMVTFIKEQVPPSYNDQIIKELDESVEIDEDGDVDDLLPQAIEMVVESGQASVLMLQRRLKVGYNRAARLIDQMEERRIIGGHEGSKPRKVLVSREDLEELG